MINKLKENNFDPDLFHALLSKRPYNKRAEDELENDGEGNKIGENEIIVLSQLEAYGFKAGINHHLPPKECLKDMRKLYTLIFKTYTDLGLPSIVPKTYEKDFTRYITEDPDYDKKLVLKEKIKIDDEYILQDDERTENHH